MAIVGAFNIIFKYLFFYIPENLWLLEILEETNKLKRRLTWKKSKKKKLNIIFIVVVKNGAKEEGVCELVFIDVSQLE